LTRTNRRADERTREEAARKARDDAARRESADRLQRCARGRAQLDTLLRGGPVLFYNGRGEKVFLADSARDGEIARLRGEVRAACAGVPSAQQETATRAAAAQATRMRYCALARERVRELEHGGSQIPAWMIEEARTRATCVCASPKK
jgi:hypothetical protein